MRLMVRLHWIRMLPHQQYFLLHVLRLASHPRWHVRDMAARTFIRLADYLPLEDFWGVATQEQYSQNELHGFLLILKHYIRSRIAAGANGMNDYCAMKLCT